MVPRRAPGSVAAGNRHGSVAGDGPLAICYGTRPQVVKASVLVEALRDRWDLLTVDTGQHYSYELNALLYEQLGVCAPDLCLEVGSSDHAVQTGDIMRGTAQAFATRRPWAVVVIGDTNSTLGCALVAAKMRIPVVHVEAGLRAADAFMAEEINRRAVDACSSVLCAPSETAERRLYEESSTGAIFLTGDIARDVLMRNAGRVPAAPGGSEWPLPCGAPFIFSTLHRAELTDDPRKLMRAMDALNGLDHPVVLAAHPRTSDRLGQLGVTRDSYPGVHVISPLGYIETLAAVRDAVAVVTDSGGVQRESYWLGTPCVTMRAETEWTETVTLGANVLFPPEQSPGELADVVAQHVHRSQQRTVNAWNRNAYGDGDAASKIRDAIGTLAAAPHKIGRP